MNPNSFGRATDIPVPTIRNCVYDKSKPGSEVLEKILEAFPDVSAEWLLRGTGEWVKKEASSSDLISLAKAPSKNDKPRVEIVVATQDTTGNTTIPIINQKAAASYLTGYQSQEYFEHLDSLTMPRFMINQGQNAVFQVVNESMEPTFFDGEYVVCSKVEPYAWADIEELSVCVVVSEKHGTQIKRIKNRLRSKGFIRCKSDNKAHRDFTLKGEEILEIWVFKWKLSPYAQNRAEELYKKVDNLEDTVEDQRVIIEQLLEKMNIVSQRLNIA